MKAGSCSSVSRRPVSHNETRGRVAPSSAFRSTNARTFFTMLAKRSRPRTSSKALGSAASSETRSSSSPLSISPRAFGPFNSVPLVLKST